MGGAIVVMSKTPGRAPVKTRLAPHLGPEAAAELYGAFLEDTFARAQRVGARVGAQVFFAHAEPQMAAPRPPWLPAGVRTLAQRGDDLGARMRAAVEDAGARRVVLVGGDSPAMRDARIEAAFDACDAGEVAVGPVEDGGYNLIGLPRPHPELFEDIAWSTPSVFAATRERAREAGVRLRVLERTYDVDRPEDLDRLRRDPDLAFAPATARWLTSASQRHP